MAGTITTAIRSEPEMFEGNPVRRQSAGFWESARARENHEIGNIGFVLAESADQQHGVMPNA
jgi:hypothetical protein